MATCLNKPELPFGGMNMIFAGDFAQLPPVIGGENSALYSPVNVVILRQNMRQKGQSENDIKLHKALANMQYKACTADDITLLTSRVCGASADSPNINEKPFRNVSIITGLNVHKDEFNRLGTLRFAQETNQELVHFYSEDSISEVSSVAHCKQVQRNKSTSLTPQIQIELWNSPPSTNNKHIPGLSVMIHLNSATELEITKGQEGYVYSWEESTGSRTSPPEQIHIPGLPVNVVPLLRTSSAISCMLHDDTKININRSQVEIMPNFAMTDYCSQGKTQIQNPVDLNNCTSHQSYYTVISHSASYDGTLILPDYTDHNRVAFDPKKIQGRSVTKHNIW
ncbi:hypothetical protein ARMGADRAFT_1046900 [Armillaria gallica]|uniref:ATP-dependent DNA helicase n=1 Tax=Armillaria gallica TaxID=47427 RepID=A0A2H3DSY5_ARMGA|nr:hypothetical protein ARMGADRAFT_1046900 [Armillaria gallica]